MAGKNGGQRQTNDTGRCYWNYGNYRKRGIFKKNKKDRDTSVILKFVVSLLLIALGVVFFLVESFNAYISLVTGIIFIGFSLYGGIRSLSIEPEPELEKIPDYE